VATSCEFIVKAATGCYGGNDTVDGCLTTGTLTLSIDQLVLDIMPHTDIFTIGAGPSDLVLALWLAL